MVVIPNPQLLLFFPPNPLFSPMLIVAVPSTIELSRKPVLALGFIPRVKFAIFSLSPVAFSHVALMASIFCHPVNAVSFPSLKLQEMS